MSIANYPRISDTSGLLKRAGLPLLALLLMVLLTACAGTGKKTPGIEQRAQARWDAVLNRDLDSAYQYFSPGYRSAHSRVDYEVALRMRRVAWTSAEVLESSCEADACTVSVNVGYRVAQPVPGVPKWESKSIVKERWVRTQGEWWYVPD